MRHRTDSLKPSGKPWADSEVFVALQVTEVVAKAAAVAVAAAVEAAGLASEAVALHPGSEVNSVVQLLAGRLVIYEVVQHSVAELAAVLVAALRAGKVGAVQRMKEDVMLVSDTSGHSPPAKSPSSPLKYHQVQQAHPERMVLAKPSPTSA